MTCYTEISAVSYSITHLTAKLTQYNFDVERLNQARNKLSNKQDAMNQSLQQVISPTITGNVWRGNRRETFYNDYKMRIRDTYLKIPRNQLENIIIMLDRRISQLDASIIDTEFMLKRKRMELSDLYAQLRRESSR